MTTSNEEISRLQQKVDQHEREIAAIQTSTREMIDGQKSLTKSIQDLTLSLQRYIVQHDHVAQQNSELQKDVRVLREQSAANQLVIDGVRTFGAKITWLLISTLASPAVVAALFAFSGK